MTDDINIEFREQLNVFYYTQMRRVAQALFESGVNTRAVALNLLMTISMAKRWHDLYNKGELIKIDAEPSSYNLNLPFANPSNGYVWRDYAHEVKCAAKIFFDMGLGSRAIAIYLGVPCGTVYWWRSLYNTNRFKIESHWSIGRFKPQCEKFINIKNRKYYSSELRQAAKDCFEKGMTAYEVSKYLNIPDGTTYSWLSLFKQGRFYVNSEEKRLLSKSISSRTTENTTVIQNMPAIGLVPHGLPQSTILDWNLLFKEGRFKVKKHEKQE